MEHRWIVGQFCLADYRDQVTNAINRRAVQLSKLNEPERKAACGQIRDAVCVRVQNVADEPLPPRDGSATDAA
jgi:hypothetical protein